MRKERGETLVTMVKRFILYERNYIVAVVDKDFNLVDWVECVVEDEARHFAREMLEHSERYSFYYKKPFKAIIVKLELFGESHE
jgi:hypothetical protein